MGKNEVSRKTVPHQAAFALRRLALVFKVRIAADRALKRD
jgi:hypothetical protein